MTGQWKELYGVCGTLEWVVLSFLITLLHMSYLLDFSRGFARSNAWAYFLVYLYTYIYNNKSSKVFVVNQFF
jgi:hypothetical protein